MAAPGAGVARWSRVGLSGGYRDADRLGEADTGDGDGLGVAEGDGVADGLAERLGRGERDGLDERIGLEADGVGLET